MLARMRKIFQWDCLFEGSRARETSLENAIKVDLAGVCLCTKREGAGGEWMPWREWQAGCGYSFEEGMA